MPVFEDENLDSAVSALQRTIDCGGRIVFFGGAGVSTESGIPDFRSVDGLYHQKWRFPPERILSHDFFYSETAEFYRFYREKLLVSGVQPNPAHRKLAELEQAGKLDCIITQNIDGLHQAAGSRNVLELHGSTLRNYCTGCGAFYDADFIRRSASAEDGIPRCTECGALVKPDVVLYGEPLDQNTLEASVRAISAAGTLIIGGTSLSVYPAAGLVDYFSGKNLVLINKTASACDSAAALVIHAPIGKILGAVRV